MESAPAHDEGVSLVCWKVWGGNGRIMTPVRIPGFEGVLHATPQDSAEGGDLYYFSACGSGALARICLADARGHGAGAAAFSAALEQVFQAQIHNASPAAVLAQVNRRTVTANFDFVSTALCMSYNSLNGQVRFASAGHPHARVCRRGEHTWRPLSAGDRGRPMANIPLGVSRDACYAEGKERLQPGDRIMLHTDGLSEARDEAGALLGHTLWDGPIPTGDTVSPADQANAILLALRAHVGREIALHDDITFAVLEAQPYQRSNRYALLLRNNWRRFMGWAHQRLRAAQPNPYTRPRA